MIGKVLPDLVGNYNNTYHKGIKAIPSDVISGLDHNNQERIFISNDFKVGDIKIQKKICSKISLK